MVAAVLLMTVAVTPGSTHSFIISVGLKPLKLTSSLPVSITAASPLPLGGFQEQLLFFGWNFLNYFEAQVSLLPLSLPQFFKFFSASDVFENDREGAFVVSPGDPYQGPHISIPLQGKYFLEKFCQAIILILEIPVASTFIDLAWPYFLVTFCLVLLYILRNSPSNTL